MFLVTCSTMFVELLKVVLFKGYYHILSCLNAKIKQLFDIHKFVNIVVRPIFVGFTPTGFTLTGFTPMPVICRPFRACVDVWCEGW